MIISQLLKEFHRITADDCVNGDILKIAQSSAGLHLMMLPGIVAMPSSHWAILCVICGRDRRNRANLCCTAQAQSKYLLISTRKTDEAEPHEADGDEHQANSGTHRVDGCRVLAPTPGDEVIDC